MFSTSSGAYPSQQNPHDFLYDPMMNNHYAQFGLNAATAATGVGRPGPSTTMNGYEMSMDEQERRKLERKRARNRAAASKCRQKKMDRINDLEGQVQQEKMRSQALDNDLSRLRTMLNQLQHLVERHRTGGCASQC